jgi:hypothetical protein
MWQENRHWRFLWTVSHLLTLGWKRTSGQCVHKCWVTTTWNISDTVKYTRREDAAYVRSAVIHIYGMLYVDPCLAALILKHKRNLHMLMSAQFGRFILKCVLSLIGTDFTVHRIIRTSALRFCRVRCLWQVSVSASGTVVSSQSVT